MRLCGSLFLMYLQSSGTRCAAKLLMHVGFEPWRLGWDRLWSGAGLYWITRARVPRSSVGPLVYVGETMDMRRRCYEHIARILSPFGSTQQPFYSYIRRSSRDPHVIVSFLCEWLFFPVCIASVDKDLRRQSEQCMIPKVGTLNPPRCFKLKCLGHNPSFAGVRLFKKKRPLKRFSLRDF